VDAREVTALWQRAEPAADGVERWSLIACRAAPGFGCADFELRGNETRR
jgi:predicted cupin superfamily sugar epimerase